MDLGPDAFGFQIPDGHQRTAIKVHVEAADFSGGVQGQNQRGLDRMPAGNLRKDRAFVRLGELGKLGKDGRGRFLLLLLVFRFCGGRSHQRHVAVRHGDAQDLAGSQFPGFQPVEVHDFADGDAIEFGDVVNILEPADHVLPVLSAALGRGLGPGRLAGTALLERNEDDGVFLESGFPQRRVGLIEHVFRDAIGPGDAIDGLAFQDDVRQVDFAVQTDFLLGDGYRRGHIFLGKTTLAESEADHCRYGEEAFHTHVSIKSWRRRSNTRQSGPS